MIKQITMYECKCERCKHIWKTRDDKIPKVCSRCKRVDWNEGEKKIIEIKQIGNDSALIKYEDGETTGECKDLVIERDDYVQE